MGHGVVGIHRGCTAEGMHGELEFTFFGEHFTHQDVWAGGRGIQPNRALEKAFGVVVAQAAKAAQKALDDNRAQEKEAADAAAKESAGMDAAPMDSAPPEPPKADVPGMDAAK